MIYFVRAEQVGYIKIGFHESDDPKGRVRDLQVGSPVKLTLLGTIPGDRGTESDLHRRFAHAHHQGEWFKPTPDLLEFIGSLGANHPQGPVGIVPRFVEIKALTVNRKQMTKALFNQLPHVCVIDWEQVANCQDDLSTVQPGSFDLGPCWGFVIVDNRAYLLWQRGEILCVMRLKTHDDYDYGGWCPDEAGEVCHKKKSYETVKNFWLRSVAHYRSLEQLFIGV